MSDNKFCQIFSFNDVDAPEGENKNNREGMPQLDAMKLQKVLNDNFSALYETSRDQAEKTGNLEEVLQSVFLQLNFILKLFVDHNLETNESLRKKNIEYMAEFSSAMTPPANVDFEDVFGDEESGTITFDTTVEEREDDDES